MFTDTEATPARVEMLLDVVRSMTGRKLDATVIRGLLQPEGLPGRTEASDQAGRTIAAARDLDLIADQGDGMIRPARARDHRSARQAVLEALDQRILSDDSIEPWFALFYAFLLGRDAEAPAGPVPAKEWETRFERELFPSEKPTNRFNDTKYRGLRRWLRYAGLGWHDSAECFHPNPYSRLARQLPAIFESKRELSIDRFMERLAEKCPELDGGLLFQKANPGWEKGARSLTLGLAHALVDLHSDGVLTLDCPLDTDGWSIAKASPPRDSEHLKSDRVASVRYAPTKEAGGHG